MQTSTVGEGPARDFVTDRKNRSLSGCTTLITYSRCQRIQESDTCLLTHVECGAKPCLARSPPDHMSSYSFLEALTLAGPAAYLTFTILFASPDPLQHGQW